MLRYLKANMGIDPSPLAARDEARATAAQRHDQNHAHRLAWMTTAGIIWHNAGLALPQLYRFHGRWAARRCLAPPQQYRL